jgi:phenylalanyl-tRNA synthetase beta chain
MQQEALGLSQPVFLFEWALTTLAEQVCQEADPRIRMTRHPAVALDFAFIVDAATPAGALLAEIQQVDPDLLREARLFDVFTGSTIPEGKKSLAINVTLHAADRTLEEQDILTLSQQIVQRAEQQFGAVLRDR